MWPAGSMLGALVLYALGAWLGYDRLHQLAGRRWFILTSRSDLERGRRWFDKHSRTTVLLGRCVPFVRSVVSAGVAGMPLGRFTLFTAIGSGLWNALFLGLGWALGTHWSDVERWLAPVGPIIIGLVVFGQLWLVARKLRGRAADVS